ncbi:DNA adenine methylase [Halostella salina]|uniref:DNA adenine methylase n=1 Tax=Halostella salina TaxID=1547897 RepID=UPI000EF7F037|nr:DNA adenine methylase [Halostella salina]
MALSAFPYIGGKTNIAQWITDQLPDHRVYVEPFGGSAAVLLNKPRSDIEVYNDLDRDIVQFFEVAREQTDELVEWCRRTPFSEELHNEWGRAFYRGERPDDPVERAGRFLYLRYSQFGAKYHNHSGFKRDTLNAHVGESQSWANVEKKIRTTVDRLQGVSIQRNSFRDVIQRYDSADTLFYCDPPYLDREKLYPAGDEFEHSELADALVGLEGDALVSYTDRPEGLYEDWHVETLVSSHTAGARGEDSTKDVRERLLMNFDPKERPEFVEAGQTTLVS